MTDKHVLMPPAQMPTKLKPLTMERMHLGDGERPTPGFLAIPAFLGPFPSEIRVACRHHAPCTIDVWTEVHAHETYKILCSQTSIAGIKVKQLGAYWPDADRTLYPADGFVNGTVQRWVAPKKRWLVAFDHGKAVRMLPEKLEALPR